MKLVKWAEQVQDRLKWKDIVEKAKTLSCSATEEEEFCSSDTAVHFCHTELHIPEDSPLKVAAVRNTGVAIMEWLAKWTGPNSNWATD